MARLHAIIKHLLSRIWRRPSTAISSVAIFLIVAPMLLYHLLAYRLANDPRLVPSAFRHAKNILFITAHPDDETLFFSPSILYRRDDSAVSRALLVLSSGDYRGIGPIRKAELQHSCARLGIQARRCVDMDHEKLQDDPNTWWKEDLIQGLVMPYLRRWHIDLIVTFDSGGVSGHINHRAVSSAISDYVRHTPNSPPAYTVQTYSVLRKYSGLIDLIPTSIPFSWRIFKALFTSPPTESTTSSSTTTKSEHKNPYADKALLVSGWRAYFQAREAFSQYRSQYSWDRVLYLVASRYMWYNDLRAI